jgi:lipopolysaccharide export system permease protein
MAVKSPIAPIIQYLMLAIAIAVSLWIITGSVILEPPAALMETINKLNTRVLRLFRRPAAA